MGQPDIKTLQLTEGGLLEKGFHPMGFGVDGSPSLMSQFPIFSDANDILQSFLYLPGKHDYSNALKIDQDHSGNLYPEVYSAWIAAGGGEAYPNIAYVEQLGKWGVGMGGKKNGERAAKLVLACSIAKDSEHTPNVVRNYPSFGRLHAHLGIMPGGMSPAV